MTLQNIGSIIQLLHTFPDMFMVMEHMGVFPEVEIEKWE